MEQKNIGIILIVGVILILLFGKGLWFSVIPELDNRIVYWNKPSDATSFVVTQHLGEESGGTLDIVENDKFYCTRVNILPKMDEERLYLDACYSIQRLDCRTKKNFKELTTFVKLSGLNDARFSIGDASIPRSTVWGVYENFEIRPNYLEENTYDLFSNGEFVKRLRLSSPDVYLGFSIGYGSGGYSCNTIAIDYIKYVPVESFVIKSDEVWVQEVKGNLGSSVISYTINDLNWEMIGFQSQVRPATIRDLTAQTEVPAPQIYVNLINGLPVNIQPNTIHTFFYRTKWVDGLDSSCKGDLNKVETKGSDGVWRCESFDEPLQCETNNDCSQPLKNICPNHFMGCVNNKCTYNETIAEQCQQPVPPTNIFEMINKIFVNFFNYIKSLFGG